MNNVSGKINDFTDLNTWKVGHDLVLSVYEISKKFPASEKFNLTSQIQRSSVSVTSNIAEGFGRKSYKEKTQFYYLSHGSLTETKNLIIIAKDLKYINQSEYEILMQKVTNSQRLIRGIIRSSKEV